MGIHLYYSTLIIGNYFKSQFSNSDSLEAFSICTANNHSLIEKNEVLWHLVKHWLI